MVKTARGFVVHWRVSESAVRTGASRTLFSCCVHPSPFSFDKDGLPSLSPHVAACAVCTVGVFHDHLVNAAAADQGTIRKVLLMRKSSMNAVNDGVLCTMASETKMRGDDVVAVMCLAPLTQTRTVKDCASATPS